MDVEDVSGDGLHTSIVRSLEDVDDSTMDQVISRLKAKSSQSKQERRMQARDADIARNLFLRDLWRKEQSIAARHATRREESL